MFCRTLHGVPTSAVVHAGLFAGWQSCLETKPTAQLQQQQQQQQHLRWPFMEDVAHLWYTVFVACKRILLFRNNRVAPLLLGCVVPALQFASHCMQQTALASGNLNSSNSSVPGCSVSSSSSSSHSTNSSSDLSGYHEASTAALLLQQAALHSLLLVLDPKDASSTSGLQLHLTGGMAVEVALEDAVEQAALQQLAGACGLLHRLVDSPASSSSCTGIGPSSSSSSSNAALANRRFKPQRYEAADAPAFDESLLQLLPGGQAYVGALAIAATFATGATDLQVTCTDGAVTSTVVSSAAARQVAGWANTAARLLCTKSEQNMTQCSAVLAADASSSSRQQLAAAPVPQASPVHLQLFVQLQLLAATLHQQQQQQHQGVALVDAQDSIWPNLLRHYGVVLLRYIRAVTQLKLPADVRGIQQLLAGPDAPLLRALARRWPWLRSGKLRTRSSCWLVLTARQSSCLR
jgi:hypothetical protein